MQPGDNFRVAATCDPGLLATLNNDNVPANNQQVPSFNGKITDVLTVWRRLHVEVDSMGAPPGNEFWPPAGNMDGKDEAVADVKDPDRSLLRDAFKPAYVSVVFDTGKDNGNAKFAHNGPTTGSDDTEAAERKKLGKDNRGATEAPDYWVGYVMGAYEAQKSADNDPDTEHVVAGVTEPAEPEYSFVFMESIRDLMDPFNEDPLERRKVENWAQGLLEQRVVVHEIGHQFQLPHVPSSVMGTLEEPGYGRPENDYVVYDRFHDGHLALIRSVISP